MERAIRKAQLKLLKIFAKKSGSFALAGGTALELFYLQHRFSRDLDFFSKDFNLKEINLLAAGFSKILNERIKLEDELVLPGRAKVRFYTVKIKGAHQPLKIDFVEDVVFDDPKKKKFNGIPVYEAKQIYFQKILTLTGINLIEDASGREITTGRRTARDVVDIYYLSRKIEPLHTFMKSLDRRYQRGLVQWYRSYSRQEVKLGIFDLDIYDKKYDVSEMIAYLDSEIKKYMSEVLE